MKVVTVIGARPQFIKAAAVSSSLAKTKVDEVILHTGQHYDWNMSDVFFEELGIPAPKYNLRVNASTHGGMTGRMLEKIEKTLLTEKPDVVLVYGDTNSTLAGALAASKLHIPIAHIEAGLRSFNRKMPEEINRILTDHISTFLFVPTYAGVQNLKNEGIYKGVHHTGDVMYDATLIFGALAGKKMEIIKNLGLKKDGYCLATVHRAENTDDPNKLSSIVEALCRVNEYFPVVLPLHPRTKKMVNAFGLKNMLTKLRLTDPLSYLDMVGLEKNSRAIITDSGGIQKEAYFHGVPCITLREETEWTETVRAGWNTIAGSDVNKIVNAVHDARKGVPITEFGTGKASQKIVSLLSK
nr:UDP-N-acetylglucosamine 2-epimerase (non-hydrolyzing) [uncultured Desulfobacter sp.]